MSASIASTIVPALRWLSAEFAVTREQAQKRLGPMLADSLVTDGWAKTNRSGDIAIAERGIRLLADADRNFDEDAG